MNLPVQVTFHGISHSDGLEQTIREHVEKLHRFHPKLVSCRAVVEYAARHQQRGNEFVVRLDIKVPGAEIAVNHDHHEDVMSAVHQAFAAAKRRIEEHARRRRRLHERARANGQARAAP